MDKKYKSLPSWTYNSEAFFELEKEHLFLSNWQLICHTSNIPNPGDYFTFQIFNERLVAIRGEDQQVRAFHNVCAHRASRILDGDYGNCGKRLTCPYHAWSYDLKGNLIKVPYRDQFHDLKESDHGLKTVEMEIFQGFIFVKVLPSDCPSVEEQFSPYIEEILPYQFENLQPMSRITLRPRNVNWKQIADNYIDALHIPVAHPGLNSLVGKSYGLEVSKNGGYIHKMWGDIQSTLPNNLSNHLYTQFLPNVDYLPKANQKQWMYYRLWPNLALDVYPDQIDFMQFIPINAKTTLIREIPYALPDGRREMRAARYLNWRINRQVNAEDTNLINRVQEGMNSSGYESGPLAKTEVCLMDSAQKIRESIPVANLKTKPDELDMGRVNNEISL